MRQHITAVEAACALGGAECEGLAVGASEFTFHPSTVTPGEYRFAVGTAGSTGLVLQTLVMPLVLAGGPSRLVLEGGTHNMLAPPFEFIARSFLPILGRMGPRVDARLVRHGFYPRGGGRIEIDIVPAPLTPIDCVDRGNLHARSVTAFVAGLAYDIGKREIDAARKALGWCEDSFAVRQLPEDQGPGNILLIEAAFDHVTEVVSGFGKLGLPAEVLAKKAAGRMTGYIESAAFAGPYLQDQLLLPFALAGGGTFTTVKPSQHSLTAAEVIHRFLGRRPTFAQLADGTHQMELL